MDLNTSTGQMEEIKKKELLLDQYKKAQYNRNVCLYSRRDTEAKYWEGYVNALSLILETQQ
jgi:hypothetical protein